MKKGIILVFLIVSVLFISGCQIQNQDDSGNNNVKVCIHQGTDNKMTLDEAKAIAMASECMNIGTLNLEKEAGCNSGTGTWWLGLDAEMEACNPACVVNVATKTAEINGRCTGLMQE